MHGQKTFVVGEDPPSRQCRQINGNFLIASVIESLGEAFALVRKSESIRRTFSTC